MAAIQPHLRKASFIDETMVGFWFSVLSDRMVLHDGEDLHSHDSSGSYNKPQLGRGLGAHGRPVCCSLLLSPPYSGNLQQNGVMQFPKFYPFTAQYKQQFGTEVVVYRQR
jgi:hypothetical protein